MFIINILIQLTGFFNSLQMNESTEECSPFKDRKKK